MIFLLTAQPVSARESIISSSISNLHVYSVAQDSLGFIWIATANGLCRHQGDSYEIFYGDPADPNAMLSNNTTKLYYRHPVLWIASGRGVASKDIRSRKFTRYVLDENTDGFIKGFVEYQGDLYAYGFGGIFGIDETNHVLVKKFSSPYSDLNCATVTGDGSMWTAFSQHLVKLNAQFKPVEDVVLPDNLSVSSLLSYDNKVILGTNRGLKIYDKVNGKIVAATTGTPFDNAEINSMRFVSPEMILVTTRNSGQFFYDVPSEICSIKTKDYNLSYIQDEDISTSYIDNNNNLWLGTFDKGLLLAHDYTSVFNPDIKLQNTFIGNFITRIKADEYNRLWIGTRYQGLKVYDRNTGDIYSVRLGDDNSFVQDIFKDSQRRMWVGHDLDLTVGDIIPDPERLGNARTFKGIGNVVTAAEDSAKKVWIGTSDNGIIIFDSKLSNKTSIVNSGLNSPNITKIIPTPSGKMLVAAYADDIYVVDPVTLQSKPLAPHFRKYWATAVDMFLDTDMRLWVGTYDNGLICFEFNTGRVRLITDFQSRDMVSITEDSNGNIWVGSSNGLYSIDKKTFDIRSYMRGKGILGNQYHEKGSFRAPDGSLYFGGNAGLQQVMPQHVNKEAKNIPVYLTSLVPMYKGFSPNDTISETEPQFIKDVTLAHSNNGVSLKFAALDYNQAVEYSYKLEGYDKKWINSGDYTRAVYSRLPAGNYKFWVRTCVGGVWSDPVCLLDIHIQVAPWLHPLAICAYVLTLGLIIIFLIKLYIRLKLEKGRIALAEKRVVDEREMTAHKINFFNNISHELRTPLTLICAPLKQLQTNIGKMKQEDVVRDLDYINTNVHRLLNLTTQILNFREIEGETLPLAVSHNDVCAQIENITSLFKIYAAEKSISIELVCHIKENSVVYDADKFEKIVNNLLFNAVKYTPEKGHIIVRLELTRHPECIPSPDGIYLELVVSDNGIGIRKNKDNFFKIFNRFTRLINPSSAKSEGFGIGLDFVRKIVSIHHGAIVGRSNTFKGMTFTVDLPAEESAYSPEEFEKLAPNEAAVDDENATTNASPETEKKQNKTDDEVKPSVLVVEDNNDLQDFIVSVLSDDFEVFTASNGNEGLEIAREKLPDVIISDIMMPLMDGMEMINILKNDPVTSHIPIIVLTAKNRDSDLIEGYDSGAGIYMSKPFNPEVLKAAIHSLLSNIELQKKALIATAGTNTDAGVTDVQISGLDRVFLEKLYAYIDKNISNTELNVNLLGKELGFSRSNFYRKIKALTGESPNDMLRIYRLNRAAELLREHSYNIGEIADLTGFATPSHFTTLFKRMFGTTPSEYVKNL